MLLVWVLWIRQHHLRQLVDRPYVHLSLFRAAERSQQQLVLLRVIRFVEVYNPESAVQFVALCDNGNVLDELEESRDMVTVPVVKLLRVQEEDDEVLLGDLELGLRHLGREFDLR